ncbi:sulfatase-like hydrolase/transferase [Halodesulfurarchaeum formicicum]|uniref:Sulfatase n=1 Tax=Halodesulfurarchaeum formicicum TaxID=1873524 RepID=A0A1J1AB16_9EURY|nr:sulfatase-like hydrolase/transferase [Halodesulfurarchaeum formicicum]APE95332.1 sulfatase [Halodesulfurarchaeum formicicum]
MVNNNPKSDSSSSIRNVVLLCLDSVRKDYFDRYAKRLNEQSDVVYNGARAASGWSLPSHASMFTGELPHSHGAHAHSDGFEPISITDTFLSDLPNHSILGVSTNTFAGEAYGFDKYFDVFSEVPHNSFQLSKGVSPEDFGKINKFEYLKESIRDNDTIYSLINGIISKFGMYERIFSGRPWPEINDNGTARSLQLAESHITNTESAENPVFVFLNLMESHSPMYAHYNYDSTIHTVPNSWTSANGPKNREVSFDADSYREYINNWTDIYSASIDYLDRVISDWIERINTLTENETTIVVTSDHGQNLGNPSEEELFGHQSSLSEGILHVPLLIINPPDGYQEQVDRLISHLEIGSLITHLANEDMYKFSNNSVTSEVVGTIKSHKNNLTYWDRPIRCSYKDETKKVLWDGLETTKIYDIDESIPNVQNEIDIIENMTPEDDDILFEVSIKEMKRKALRDRLSSGNQDLSDDVQSRLSDLGYV